MKNLVNLLGIIFFVGISCFNFISCPERDNEPELPINLTGTVSIIGVAQVGQTLFVNTSALDGSGAISYQWIRGGATIIGSNSIYIVQTTDVGSTITVTVTRSDNSGSIVSVPTSVITLPPLTGTVSITGTAEVGKILTADTSSLNGTSTISYQWMSDETPIGINSATYTVQDVDVGSMITVTVSRSGISGSVTSEPTDVVTFPTLPSGTIGINETAQVGQILSVNTSALEGSGAFSYEWKIDDIDIGTNSTYTVQFSDVNSSITVTVTRSGMSGSVTSDPTNIVPQPTVSIEGIFEVGQMLTADINNIVGTISYQWKRGEINIGSNSSTYTLQAADVGSTITVTIVRSGISGSVTSEPTDVVIYPPLTGTVSITGTTEVGQTLTANTSLLGGSGTISYQWKRGTTDIGTDSNTYTVQQIDADSTITVTVTRSGNSSSLTSTPTAVVVNNPATPGLAYALINSNTAYSVSRGTATASNVVIPEIYNGLPVVSIANNGFSSYTSMTSIVISDRITSIGSFAFSNCSGLTEITIPNSVTDIGSGAFSGCSNLTSITIPFVGTTLNGSVNTNFGFIFGASSATGQNSFIPVSLKTVIVTGSNIIGNNAFLGCANLTSITLPNSVMSIGNNAFQNCSGLTNFTIPGNVTSIGNNTFSGCSSLTNISIPNGVTSIGQSAFQNCSSLTGITIPDNVTSIGQSAFQDCSNLTSITIPGNVTSIGINAFQGCSGLTSITLPTISQTFVSMFGANVSFVPVSLKTVIINGGTIIPNNSFSGCSNLTEIIIPNNVTSIGNSAFQGCSGLTSITIPSNVTSIGSSAFQSCNGLTSITLPTVSQTFISMFGSNASSVPVSLKTVVINGGTSIPSFSFSDYNYSGCSGLTSITIPNSVTSIGNAAFVNCSGLTELVLPNSVTSIGDRAFSGCTGLTSITIPSSVTSIGHNAFSGCTGLTSITIPSSVTSIGDWAFSGCTGLTSITIPSSVTSIGNSAFFGCTGLTEITILNNVTSIGDWAFSGCTGLTSITIPSSVTSIGSNAFQNCSGLTSITLPVVSQTFVSMFGPVDDVSPVPVSLKTVVINGGNSIPNNSFSGYSGLTSITIPSSVTSIGSGAFSGCTGLTSITIPNSVTSIGSGAFSGCTGLTSITIPNSVTSIGYSAFSGCTGLTEITIPNSVTSIGYSAFFGCTGLTEIIIPSGVTSIGDYTFSGCTGLTEIVIPSGVTSIGRGAFFGCTGLTEITIPNSVTSIGEEAFRNCIGLTSIVIPSSVTNIGVNVFQGCVSLEIITLPAVSLRFVSMFGPDNQRYDPSLIPVKTVIINGGNRIPNGSFLGYYTNGMLSYLPAGCRSLTSIIIGNSVESIGDEAFRDCIGLTSITIPESVTSIGYDAFRDCTGLTSVTLGGTITFFSSAFPGNLRSVYSAAGGGAGTYVTTNPGTNPTWTKW